MARKQWEVTVATSGAVSAREVEYGPASLANPLVAHVITGRDGGFAVLHHVGGIPTLQAAIEEAARYAVQRTADAAALLQKLTLRLDDDTKASILDYPPEHFDE